MLLQILKYLQAWLIAFVNQILITVPINKMHKYSSLQLQQKQKYKGQDKPDQSSSLISSAVDERKDKNQRKLWQILQKQLNMSQDQMQYQQWVDSLIIDSNISIRSTNIKIYKYRQICYKITIIFLIYEILYFQWYFLNPFSISMDFNLNISDFLSISSMLNAALSTTYSIISFIFNIFNPLFFLDFYSLFKSMIGYLMVTLFKIFRVLLLLYLAYRSLQRVKNGQEKIKNIERIRDSIIQTLLLIVFNLLISNLIRYLLLPQTIIVLTSYFIFLTQKNSKSLHILSLIIYSHQANYHHDMVHMNFSEYLYPFIQTSLTLIIISHTRFTFSQSISSNVHYFIILHIMYLIFSQQFSMLFIFLLVMALVKFIELIDQKFLKFKSKNIIKSRKLEINSENNQIKYKDYRKYWDITLPIEQYH